MNRHAPIAELPEARRLPAAQAYDGDGVAIKGIIDFVINIQGAAL